MQATIYPDERQLLQQGRGMVFWQCFGFIKYLVKRDISG
jgi:hypothetical protein